MNTRSVVIALCICAVFSTQSLADMMEYGFFNVTHNAGNPDVGSQLVMQVTDVIPDLNGNGSADEQGVLFTFLNTGPIASSIGAIYYRDGGLMATALIDDDENADDWLLLGMGNIPANPVDFELDSKVNPPHLPGADAYGFKSVFFATDWDDNSNDGVGVGESLGVLFTGKSYATVVGELNSGEMLVGLHVQQIGPNGGSDSYVMTPVPGAVLLGFLGLGYAGIKLRKVV